MNSNPYLKESVLANEFKFSSNLANSLKKEKRESETKRYENSTATRYFLLADINSQFLSDSKS